MHELFLPVRPKIMQVNPHVGVLCTCNVGKVNVLLDYGHAFDTLATPHMIAHFILLGLRLLILPRWCLSSDSSGYGLCILGEIVIIA